MALWTMRVRREVELDASVDLRRPNPSVAPATGTHSYCRLAREAGQREGTFGAFAGGAASPSRGDLQRDERHVGAAQRAGHAGGRGNVSTDVRCALSDTGPTNRMKSGWSSVLFEMSS